MLRKRFYTADRPGIPMKCTVTPTTHAYTHTAMPKGCETLDMFHLTPCHLPLVPTYNWRIKISPGKKERTAGFLWFVCLRETRKNKENNMKVRGGKNLQECYWQGANYAEIG